MEIMDILNEYITDKKYADMSDEEKKCLDATNKELMKKLDLTRELVAKEQVNHLDHYNNNPSGVECIDVVEHMTFNSGNAVKYLWRAGSKGDLITDLKKAVWYINREIARLEKGNEEN